MLNQKNWPKDYSKVHNNEKATVTGINSLDGHKIMSNGLTNVETYSNTKLYKRLDGNIQVGSRYQFQPNTTVKKNNEKIVILY